MVARSASAGAATAAACTAASGAATLAASRPQALRRELWHNVVAPCLTSSRFQSGVSPSSSRLSRLGARAPCKRPSSGGCAAAPSTSSHRRTPAPMTQVTRPGATTPGRLHPRSCKTERNHRVTELTETYGLDHDASSLTCSGTESAGFRRSEGVGGHTGTRTSALVVSGNVPRCSAWTLIAYRTFLCAFFAAFSSMAVSL
jgi:hypothetical protein